MFLKQIDDGQKFQIPSMSFKALSETDKRKIEESRTQYLIAENVDSSFIYFPGTIYSDKRAAHGFGDYVIKSAIEKNFPNVPRGNLTSGDHPYVIGYMPGHDFDESFKGSFPFKSCAWDFGPSTDLLLKFFEDLDICPYLSNVFQCKEDFQTKNLQTIITEIGHLVKMNSVIYKKKSIDIFLLGNYDEYYKLSQEIRKQKWFKGLLKINVFRIWHPSYILRSLTAEKLTMWKNQFIKKLHRMV